jgi:hypothetical protein
MLLETVILTVALNSPKDLSTSELVRYYWDCDTSFMKDELHPNDVLGCIAITDELKNRKWNGSQEEFLKWWKENRHREWYKRGYIHKPK